MLVSSSHSQADTKDFRAYWYFVDLADLCSEAIASDFYTCCLILFAFWYRNFYHISAVFKMFYVADELV